MRSVLKTWSLILDFLYTVHFANTCFSLGADTGYWAEHTVNLQKPNLNLENQLISLALSWNWFPVGHAGLDACCFSPWISCCGESSWGVARVGGPRKRRKCKFMFKVGIHFFKPYYFAFKLLVSSVLYFQIKKSALNHRRCPWQGTHSGVFANSSCSFGTTAWSQSIPFEDLNLSQFAFADAQCAKWASRVLSSIRFP